VELRADVRAIRRNIGADSGHLTDDTPSGEARKREHQEDHGDDGGNTAYPPLEPHHGGRQHEGQQDCQADGNENDLGPIQYSYDQDAAGESDPGARDGTVFIHR
jgi:hypothetical protein